MSEKREGLSADHVIKSAIELGKELTGVARLEILEGRVAALEKIIANAPGPKGEVSTKEWDRMSSETAAEKVADADDRVERIFSQLIDFAVPTVDQTTPIYTFSENDLKRGIRKALNEFYRGPVNDQQARIVALINEKEALERDVREYKQRGDMLYDRLQRTRDLLDEEPDAAEQRILGAALMRERE